LNAPTKDNHIQEYGSLRISEWLKTFNNDSLSIVSANLSFSLFTIWKNLATSKKNFFYLEEVRACIGVNLSATWYAAPLCL